MLLISNHTTFLVQSEINSKLHSKSYDCLYLKIPSYALMSSHLLSTFLQLFFLSSPLSPISTLFRIHYFSHLTSPCFYRMPQSLFEVLLVFSFCSKTSSLLVYKSGRPTTNRHFANGGYQQFC